MIPLNGGEVFWLNEEKGLPGNSVRALVWHEGKLYAMLEGGTTPKPTFVSCDPAARTYHIIASKSAFDARNDIDPRYHNIFEARQLFSDAKRERIWMPLQNVLMYYDPQADAFEPLYLAPGMPWFANGERPFFWQDGHLLAAGGRDGLYYINLDKMTIARVGGKSGPEAYTPLTVAMDGENCFRLGSAGVVGTYTNGYDKPPVKVEPIRPGVALMDKERIIETGTNLVLWRPGEGPVKKEVPNFVFSLQQTRFGILAIAGENSYLIKRKVRPDVEAPLAGRKAK